MSEVISFRLDNTNPREAQALEVLIDWSAKGYSTRHIITEALLNLEDFKPGTKIAIFDELTEALSQFGHLLEQIGNGNSSPAAKQSENQSQSKLTSAFVASLRKSAKPGMKLDR